MIADDVARFKLKCEITEIMREHVDIRAEGYTAHWGPAADAIIRAVERYDRSRTPTPEEVEAVARAYDPMGWAWYDRAEADHPTKPIFLDNAFTRARAAIAASDAWRAQELERMPHDAT